MAFRRSSVCGRNILRRLWRRRCAPIAVKSTQSRRLAAHHNEILLDAKLFARIDRLHADRASLSLRAEELRLLERVHLDFTLAGARLSSPAKKRLEEIVERLATLTTQFEPERPRRCEVLDADGFSAFVEAGNAFDTTLAERLRHNVYAAGGTVDPSVAYRAFRGREPSVEPMLAQRGLIEDPPLRGIRSAANSVEL